MPGYSARELMKLANDNDIIDQFNVWLARGDSVAVYENQALDSSGLGDKQFVSFGSPAAQLETDEPPVQLPDIGNKINWRFRLIGTYSGEQIRHLPTPNEEEWHTPYDVAERIVGAFTGEKYNEGRRSGPFEARISSWRLEVLRIVDGSGNPTEAQRVEVTIKLLDPAVRIFVRSWLYEDGINVLAPFDWVITDDDHGTRTGTDPNLGGAVVAVYNNSLPPKEG